MTQLCHSPSRSRSPVRSKPGSPQHLPSQTHRTSLIPHVLPAPALVESVAGGAHFSGGGRPQSPEGNGNPHDSPKESPLGLKKRVSSPGPPPNRHSVHHRGHSGTWDGETEHLTERKKQVLKDLKELYGCKPTQEIFARSWRKDATFEVRPFTLSCCAATKLN